MDRLYDYRYYNLLSYLISGRPLSGVGKPGWLGYWLEPEARIFVSVALIMAKFDGWRLEVMPNGSQEITAWNYMNRAGGT